MANTIEQIPLWNIVPSRWQPRDTKFDEDALVELANSIQANGLINPISIFAYPDEDGYTIYELIAGERRTRASIAIALASRSSRHDLDSYARRLANIGLTGLGSVERQMLKDPQVEIAANILPGDDLQRLHIIAVVENLDRANLSPVEEGRAYHQLQQTYGWSQRELATRVNKSQGYVAQRLALLTLPQEAQNAVNTRVLTIAHAREIATLPDEIQPAATESVLRWVDTFTTREIHKRLRAVRNLIDSNRWKPNPQAIYEPAARNWLNIIRHAIETAELPSIANDLMEQSTNYIIRERPIRIVTQRNWREKILNMLGSHGNWHKHAEDLGMMCDTCIFRDVHPTTTDAELNGYCRRWKLPDLDTCCRHIAENDPVIIPAHNYHISRALRAAGHAHQNGRINTYADNIDAYMSAHEEAIKNNQINNGNATEMESLDEIREVIRAYYNWQLSITDDITETQAAQCHFCTYCHHHAPLLEPEGLPPCQLALNPLRNRQGNPIPPEFGALITQHGFAAPRCQGFTYNSHPPSIEPVVGVRLPPPEQTLAWLKAIVINSETGNSPAAWGILSWLPYGRQDKLTTQWSALKKYLLSHWEQLGGDIIIAQLINIAASEIALFAFRTRSKPVDLLSTNGQTETWLAAHWPFTYYAEYSWATRDWPDDWPHPWEENNIEHT